MVNVIDHFVYCHPERREGSAFLADEKTADPSLVLGSAYGRLRMTVLQGDSICRETIIDHVLC